MAVVSCHLDRVTTADIDNRNRGTYSADYVVETDSAMGAKQVLNNCLAANLTATDPQGQPNQPIPNIAAAYDLTAVYGTGESDPYSYALGYHCETHDARIRKHTITVTWTPLQPGETPEQRQAVDPEERGARFRWDSETYVLPVDKDKDGVPIVNGADVSPDRPLQIERERPLLVARFNVASLDECVTLQQTYSQAVNSTAWTFFTPNTAARTVCCRSAKSGDRITEGSYSYYPMEFVFAFAETGKTWDEEWLNEGYGHYEEADSQSYGYAFASSNFTTSTDPIPLTGGVVAKNGTGGALSAPTSVAQPSPALSGSAGDQLSLVYVSSAWAVGEPTAKVDAQGNKIYKKAKALDAAGAETGDDVSEPILLYKSGVRLPKGMKGNYISNRVRREVDFNNLNALLTPA